MNDITSNLNEEKLVVKVLSPAERLKCLILSFWSGLLLHKNRLFDVCKIPLLGKNFYLVINSTLISYVLKEWDKYPKEVCTYADGLLGIAENSIFSTNGAVWLSQRKALLPAFSSLQPRNTFDLMYEAVEKFEAGFLNCTKNKKLVVFTPHVHHVVADIIHRVIFSEPLKNSESLYRFFEQYQQTYLHYYTILSAGFKSKLLRKKLGIYAKRIQNIVDTTIELRKKSCEVGEKKDLLDYLLAVRDEKSGLPLTDDELMQNITTFFLAGHETSAVSLNWTFYLLAKHNSWQKKIRQEIKTVLGEEKRITLCHLNQFKLVAQVFKESLRLYPPIYSFLRETLKDEDLCGIHVKPGDTLNLSIYDLHRDEKHWEDADTFNPGRFAQKEEKNTDPAASCHHQQTAYYPFGAGRRACPGKGFATQEAILIIASFLLKYEISLPKGFKIHERGKLTLKSNKELQLILTLLN